MRPRHASLAYEGFLEMIPTTATTTGQLSFVDERCTLVNITEEKCIFWAPALHIVDDPR